MSAAAKLRATVETVFFLSNNVNIAGGTKAEPGGAPWPKP